jgi:hypothetical protein
MALTRTGLYVRRSVGGLFAVEDMAISTGVRIFVHSTDGTDAAGYGTGPDKPVATIDYAVSLCTANENDIIYVMPGHVESLADAQIDLDVAGISVIGLGNGPDRPQIHYDHANASLDIGASGVLVENLTFLPSVADVLIGVDIEAAVTNTTIKNCEFLPGEAGDGTDEFVLGIDIKAGCTRTTIDGVLYAQDAAAASPQAAIILTGASDLVTIKNCDLNVIGAGANACIEGITTLSTRILIDNCTLTTDAEPGIELLTNTTGIIRNCCIFADLGTIDAATVADKCAHFNVLYCEVGNEAGTLVKTESVDD